MNKGPIYYLHLVCVRECFSLLHLTCNRYLYTQLLKRVNNKSKNYVHIKTKLQGKCLKGTICILFISGASSISGRREERRKRDVLVLPLTLILSMRHKNTWTAFMLGSRTLRPSWDILQLANCSSSDSFFSSTNKSKWKQRHTNILAASQNLWHHHMVFFYPKLETFASPATPENCPGHFQEAEITPEFFLG